MSRTVRYRPEWLTYYNWKFETTERWSVKARDGKPVSLLYEGQIKCGGWSRDFVTGPNARKWYKKVARRARRREQIDTTDLES